jgi:hypothetical protein
MPSAVAYRNYTVRLLELHPLPLSGTTIPQEKYIATIRIVTGVSGGDVVH